MAMKTRFEELESQLMATRNREEQDSILDLWLEYRYSTVVESPLARRYDPEYMGRRTRAAFEPQQSRRIKKGMNGRDMHPSRTR